MSPRRAGFTLLEMLAVVVILGLVAGIVLPGLGFTSAQALDDQARHLAADLEFARQRTVMTAVPHRVVLDLDAGAWWLEWQPEPEPEQEEPESDDGPLLGRVIDLSPPAVRVGDFVPLPGGAGRGAMLDRGVAFGGIETDEGVAERDQVAVAFDRDGTSNAAEILLLDESGFGVVVEVRPLADAVRVFDAES